uniref:Uncharacterized protein n=1 Tax=Vitis vinifera TaxID=29760 RepID=A5AY64_VITVI|nr:hypothetical protein VITISV_022745 [Vitis vinifera]
MNFMSYVAEVSREWGEPNARDKGRMMSQPKAKGEMYILNDGMNMKAKIAAMERRLEELEMNQMQEVQAISLTPLLPMACSICRSYEHLVDECPTIPAEREMFGDCNTYNSNWTDHPKFSWKLQPPQYKQHVQAFPQASSLEQAMVNLSKFVGDFVGAQKAINAQLNQRIDRVESTLNKRMDGMQNDISQKFDNIQYSISRLTNLNTMQEKENSPSQPYQNSKGIHVVEAQEEESSMVKEVKTVITLSGKEVDLPTCKLEHKVESETEKEKREEIKGKKKGKSIEKDDYEVNVRREPQRIVIKELMKKHMPPPFLQALYGKVIQTKAKTGVCEISQPLRNRHFAAKPVRSLRPLSAKIFAAAKPLLAHECHFVAQESPFCSYETAANHQSMKDPIFAGKAPFRKGFHSCEATFWHMSAISQHNEPHFATATRLRNPKALRSQKSIASNGARFGFETEKLWPFEDDCANHERKCRTPILLLLDTFLKHFMELKLCIPYLVSKLGKSEVQSFKRCEITFELRNGYEMISKLRKGCEITSKHRNGLQIAKLTCEMEEEPIAAAEETMPPKETTRIEAKVLIQPIQEATTDTSAPHDLTIT